MSRASSSLSLNISASGSEFGDAGPSFYLSAEDVSGGSSTDFGRGVFFETFESREKTFKSYKKHGKLHGRDRSLCEARFYQIANTDDVQCHDCHVNISLSEIDQQYVNSWILHVRYSPDCKFVLSKNGKRFVDQYKLPSRRSTIAEDIQSVQELKTEVANLRRQVAQKDDEALRRMDSMQSQIHGSLESQREMNAAFAEHRDGTLRRLNSMQDLMDTSMESQQDLRSLCSATSDRVDDLRDYVFEDGRQRDDRQQELEQDVFSALRHIEDHAAPNNTANSQQVLGLPDEMYLPTVLNDFSSMES